MLLECGHSCDASVRVVYLYYYSRILLAFAVEGLRFANGSVVVRRLPTINLPVACFVTSWKHALPSEWPFYFIFLHSWLAGRAGDTAFYTTVFRDFYYLGI